MHTLIFSLLAVTGFGLVHADSGRARVTQAPALPKIFRRQNDICPPGAYTLCPDGFGCCEEGAPCTTIRGEPACDTECSGLPCGDAGLCCDAVCEISLGSAICVHPSTATLGDFDDLNDDDLTSTFDDFPTITLPTVTSGSATRPTTPSDTTEDFPTATPTSTTEPGFDEDDDEETTTTRPRPTVTNVPSGGADDEEDNGDSDSGSNNNSNSNNNDDDSSSNSGDNEEQSGGGDTDGAGTVSAQGTFVMVVLALVGGAFLLR
ncbi:hypothetical protein BJY04DRAFT_133793 [Aspergillus karnatakaensis]|uniref:uncharacterized protein n=1 Tax=Aspergillus karnatakaensis TaxID=1810916 RepID=UPI003CCE4783